MVGRADVPVNILTIVETILHLLTFSISPLNVIGCLLEVLVHDVLLLKISELTDTVIL